MIGAEFEKRVKRLGQRTGQPVRFDKHHGNGSHGRLYYGTRFTTLKDRKKRDRYRFAESNVSATGYQPG